MLRFQNHRLMYHLLISCITSVIFGYVLRLALDYKNNNLNRKLALVQAICAVSISYVAYLLKRDYTINISLELFLFLVSFFGTFIVSIIDKMGKVGIKEYVNIALRKYLAEVEHDNVKPQVKRKPNDS